jgi:ATP-dependent DNA helicase DinG
MVEQFFAAGGPLTGCINGYRPRPQQIELAKGISGIVQSGGILVAEGPTGVGKSLAGLAGAVPRALEAMTRVIISTSTLALQGQLLKKDIPLYQQALGRKLDFRLLKGRGNYLCRCKIGAIKESGGRLTSEMKALLEWKTGTGDIADYPGRITSEMRRAVLADRDDCPDRKCPLCFHTRARELAEEANVLVVNHALLCLASRYEDIIPTADTLICDEAHDLEDWMRRSNERTVSVRRIERALDAVVKLDLDDLEEDDLGDIHRVALTAFDALLGVVSGKSSVRVKQSLNRIPELKQLCTRLQHLSSYITRRALGDERDDDLDEDEWDAGPDEDKQEFAYRVKKVANRLYEIADDIESVLIKPSPSWANWIARHTPRRGNDYATAHGQPIDVSISTRAMLGSYRANVLMSATMRVGGTFDHLKRGLGIPDARELAVGSPFDFHKQAVLVTPKTMPKIGKNGQGSWPQVEAAYRQAVAEHVLRVIQQCAGGVLALFTSRASLEHTARYLEGRALPPGVTLLVQNDEASRDELAERFRSDVNSVLLGLASFRTGLDVPGPALRCVVLDKLPFDPIDDPVESAITEWLNARSDNGAFRLRGLPRMALSLRQGLGRLIRSQDDYGVLVLLDRRAEQGGSAYWKYIQDSRPSMYLLDDVDKINGALARMQQGKRPV